MAYYWVQQWFALPLIQENPMGNEQAHGGDPLSESLKRTQRQSRDQKLDGSTQKDGPINPIVESVPSHSAQSLPNQINSGPPVQSRQLQYTYGILPSQDAPNAYSVTGNVSNSLPDYHRENLSVQLNSQEAQQRSRCGSTATLTPAAVYQLQTNAQFAGQTTTLLDGNQSSNQNLLHPQFRQGFSGAHNQHLGHLQSMPSTHMMALNINHNLYPTYPQSQQYAYWPNLYNNPAMLTTGTYHNPGLYERRSSAPLVQGHYYHPGAVNSIVHNPNANRRTVAEAVGGNYGMLSASATKPSLHNSGITRHMSDSDLSTMPRGPPRKPKQSGHALWIGNLPPGTNIIDLKNHFSRDAMNDIESLFLISKSNCAFVNYKTEDACAAAMHRFHDSRFYGVRLVCRLRRSAAPALGVPVGSSAMVSNHPTAQSLRVKVEANKADGVESGLERANEERILDPTSSSNKVAEKYFIVKSLTLQDLEISVKNGIWATQSHNEEKFNNAYHTADKVYLIFSANKSGEYFGYARMVSPILSDAEEIQRKAPHSSLQSSAVEAPRTIPTQMTETAPKGHIIDDSARGTIFWEAERSDSDENDEPTSKVRDELDPETDPDVPATWGKPFRIEWLSTTRLPFFRTRGLRNPWNANREVKIARDGTELEISAGRKLIQMFVGAAQVPLHQAVSQLGIGQINTVQLHDIPPGVGQTGV